MDNILTLGYFIRTMNVQISNLTCGSTSIKNTNIYDKSCINIFDFNQLNFSISNSKFFNKNLLNDHVIKATSDQSSLDS